MTSTAIGNRALSRIVSDSASLPLRVVALYFKRRKARRELDELTVDQLRDVGIPPDAIGREHKLPVDPLLISRLQNLV